MMENIDQFWEDDDGERMRKGEDKYSQPLMNISGPVPAAVLIYILLL